jgi:hypothetical protein
MSVGKLAVLAIALVCVSGGMGAALADWNNPEPAPAMDLVDVDARKDDGTEELLLAEEEDDDDLGNAGAGGAQNVSPPVPAIAGDGDATVGDDGTAGGANPQASPVPAPPLVAGGAGGGTPDDAGGAGGAGAGAGAGAAGGDTDDGGGAGAQAPAAGGDTDD